jgi:tripartite-type tricarboxylate transporter receptor subunit TctC
MAQALPSWPSRPIRLVSPFAPGGPQDVPGRFMLEWLTPRLGQPVLLEHRTGAGGALGMQHVAQSADGHSFLLTSSAVATLPAMRCELGFDPFADLVPVTLVSESPLTVTVRAADGPPDLAAYLARARANPGRVSFGTSGIGSATHLAGALLMQRAGIELLHVPYRGTQLALNAVLAGDTGSVIADLSIVLPHVRAGTLRALAVTTSDPVPLLPGVPALREQVPGYVVPFWIALLGGRATPPAAVGRLMAELAPLADAEGELYRRMAATGSQLLLTGPEPLERRLRQEVPLWRQVAAAAGIQPE